MSADRTRFVFACYGLGLLLAVLAQAGFWYWQGRPQPLPDAMVAGKLQCVSYSPFDKDQSPLAQPFALRPARIDADLALLSRYFSCIRTYSQEGAELLPDIAARHGLKLLLGAWIGPDEANNRQEIEKLIYAANQYPELVQAVVVGNEALLRREISGARLAALFAEVKSRISQPVTYADVWEFWRKHPEVAPAVDFITIHLLPYWEDEPMGIDRALAHVAGIREQFGREFAPKDILIGETGWPSAGRARETAQPSRLNQARFIRGFVEQAEANGWRYNLIEAFDQPWKRNNEGAVGGYWGLFDADRNDKHALTGAVSNLPDWRGWWGLSFAIAGAALLVAGRPRAIGAALGLPLWAALAATCIALWLQQAAFASRNGWEWSWATALTALNAVVLLHLALALGVRAGRRGMLFAWLERRAGWWLLAAGFAGAVLMAQLALDARYRLFPTAILLPPALAFALRPAAVDRREALLLMAVLVVGLPLQIWEEGFGQIRNRVGLDLAEGLALLLRAWSSNIQALGFAGAAALLTVALWRGVRTSRSAASSAAKAAGVTV
jgi:exo-beta-1,3-glucanase (GH17 family)